MAEFLLNRGIVCLVDEEDLEHLAHTCWFLSASNYAAGYPEGTHKAAWYMHRWLMKATPDQRVYHINRNFLDNRRANLTVKSIQFPLKSKSQYRGVEYRKNARHNPYHARLTYKKKRYDLGWYPTARDAAEMYDTIAKSMYGRHAKLNFPENKSE